MRTLVIIPARGGSKGVPKKNIKNLGGKTLIQYTIDASRKIFNDDQIIVSTDSLEIKRLVENLGLKVPFLRPKNLATDSSGTYEVILHAIEFIESKGNQVSEIILLQPTSPFRTEKHIQEALELYNSQIDMVVSVKETKSNPYYVLYEENYKGFIEKSKKSNYTRRQDCPKVFEINGAIYIINVASLKRMRINEFGKIKKYVMDEYSSHDIDTEVDFSFAEFLLKKYGDK